jgi:hypothetical protein
VTPSASQTASDQPRDLFCGENATRPQLTDIVSAVPEIEFTSILTDFNCPSFIHFNVFTGVNISIDAHHTLTVSLP